jgi:hypothetical protein
MNTDYPPIIKPLSANQSLHGHLERHGWDIQDMPWAPGTVRLFLTISGTRSGHPLTMGDYQSWRTWKQGRATDVSQSFKSCAYSFFSPLILILLPVPFLFSLASSS